MTRPGRITLVAVVVVAVVMTAVGMASLAAGRWREPDDDTRTAALGQARERRASPGVRAARQFLQRYVDDDGRVVRPDDGNDTVSEGQAYGMLLAAAIGDRPRFDLLWNWTRTNLQQPNGLLAWRWADGAVADPSPAADADLDAAHALLVAARRFDEPDFQRAGIALGRAILTHETVTGSDGRPVLVAGPWARDGEPMINPSYIFPLAYEWLARATGDPRWRQLTTTGLEHLRQLTQDGTQLPPDWARLRRDGTVIPAPAPGQDTIRYGYEAFRVLPRTAGACTPAARTLASALWRPVSQTVVERAETHHLDGRAERPGSNPNLLVAGAAAAHAAGHPERRDQLLAEADRAQRSRPAYYLGAWTALGHLLLEGSHLGGCPGTVGDGPPTSTSSTTGTTATTAPSSTTSSTEAGSSTSSATVTTSSTTTTTRPPGTTTSTSAPSSTSRSTTTRPVTTSTKPPADFGRAPPSKGGDPGGIGRGVRTARRGG